MNCIHLGYLNRKQVYLSAYPFPLRTIFPIVHFLHLFLLLAALIWLYTSELLWCRHQRDGLENWSTCCSCRIPSLDLQHQQISITPVLENLVLSSELFRYQVPGNIWHQQISVTSVLEDLILSSDLLWHQAHTWYTYIHTGRTLIHKIKIQILMFWKLSTQYIIFRNGSLMESA